MPDKHTYTLFSFIKIPKKRSAAIFLLLVCWLFIQIGHAWSQQSKREYIYLDGKLIAVETGSTTPLTVNINSPTSGSTYSTNSSPIALGGSLAGNVGVTQVTWTNNRGGSGNCSGTTTWTCGNIALQIGLNILTVSAIDELSNIGSDSLTVDYCSTTLNPASANVAAGGGGGSIGVTCASGCSWTSTSNNPLWITVTGSGSGSGSANYTVAANTGPSRNGTMTIAAQVFTVNQADGCTYSISPSSANFEASGGNGSVDVTTGAGCLWTSTSNNPDWITVTGSGSGSGSANYTVAANPGPARNGSMTIATKTFTVNQAVAPICGDGICNGYETCQTCMNDCCPWCPSCIAQCMSFPPFDINYCLEACNCNW